MYCSDICILLIGGIRMSCVCIQRVAASCIGKGVPYMSGTSRSITLEMMRVLITR